MGTMNSVKPFITGTLRRVRLALEADIVISAMAD